MTARRSLEATGRLVLCMLVAEICCVYLIRRHPYWVPLTVAVAMKPDFGSVFVRAVQRAVGTTVGVVVGGTILVVVGDDRELLPFFLVLAALLPVTIARNYGMFVTVLTPLVLIQIDALTPQPGQLVSARLLDTLLGCGIVLVLGFAVWPSTWRPRLLGDVQVAIDAVVGILRRVAGAPDPGAVSRRSAYRALSNVRTTLSQHFADPSPTGSQARILWPLVAALERILDETVRVATGPTLPAGRAADLRAAADILETVRAGGGVANTEADPWSVIADGVLRDRVREVVAAVDHLGESQRGGAAARAVNRLTRTRVRP